MEIFGIPPPAIWIFVQRFLEFHPHYLKFPREMQAIHRMHNEPPKPKGRITEKLYSQPVHPIYDTVWEL